MRIELLVASSLAEAGHARELDDVSVGDDVGLQH
jgi:hypothetical protein